MAEIIDLQEQQPQAPKFDPNKKYTWEYSAEFVLNGKDFGMLLKSKWNTSMN